MEKRIWPRHQLKIPVSLKCSDDKIFTRVWHVGETRDVSVDGMKIVSAALKGMPLSPKVEILCFPQGTGFESNTGNAEAVSMTGVVMWRDIQNGTAGIRLNS